MAQFLVSLAQKKVMEKMGEKIGDKLPGQGGFNPNDANVGPLPQEGSAPWAAQQEMAGQQPMAQPSLLQKGGEMIGNVKQGGRDMLGITAANNALDGAKQGVKDAMGIKGTGGLFGFAGGSGGGGSQQIGMSQSAPMQMGGMGGKPQQSLVQSGYQPQQINQPGYTPPNYNDIIGRITGKTI